MKRFIYFVGKPYPHRESLLKIHQLGYGIGVLLDDTFTLKNTDLFDHVIRVDFSDSKHLISQLRASNVSAAGLICTYERYVTATALFNAELSLYGNSIHSAELCTDKFLMRQAFMHADPSITPRFALVQSKAALRKFADQATYPLFLKPTNLVKSLFVTRSDTREELFANYNYIRDNIAEAYQKYHVYDHTPQIIVEEAIVGKSCSVAAFVDAAGTPHYCPGITQITTAQEKGIADNYLYARLLPSIIDSRLESRIFEVATSGIRALGMKSTPAHVEMIYDEVGNAKIVEIGARIGGYRPRMYELSYGVDMISLEILLATGHQVTPLGSFRVRTGVFELFPDTIGAFRHISGIADTKELLSITTKVKTGQPIGPAKYGYKAAAIVIISAPEPRFSELAERVSTIQVEVTQ